MAECYGDEKAERGEMRTNPNKPLTINCVLVIGYMNASKLLGVSVPTVGRCIKNGWMCRGFELQNAVAWMDV